MAKPYENVLTKKANQQNTYTDDEIKAFANCLDPDNGHMYFMENFYYIQHPVKGKLQFSPYDYQKELIDSYRNHRFSINMLPRQTGKCFSKTMNVKVKHAVTGEERVISIGELFEMQKASQTKK